jgi:hypothetical protein
VVFCAWNSVLLRSSVCSHVHWNKAKPFLNKKRIWIKLVIVSWLKIWESETNSGFKDCVAAVLQWICDGSRDLFRHPGFLCKALSGFTRPMYRQSSDLIRRFCFMLTYTSLFSISWQDSEESFCGQLEAWTDCAQWGYTSHKTPMLQCTKEAYCNPHEFSKGPSTLLVLVLQPIHTTGKYTDPHVPKPGEQLK